MTFHYMWCPTTKPVTCQIFQGLSYYIDMKIDDISFKFIYNMIWWDYSFQNCENREMKYKCSQIEKMSILTMVLHYVLSNESLESESEIKKNFYFKRFVIFHGTFLRTEKSHFEEKWLKITFPSFITLFHGQDVTGFVVVHHIY